MKELSIEEKAKRYDELLLKLQKAKVDDNVCDEMYYRVIDDIVPELKESEDEKIRKELIGFLRNIPNHNYTCEEMALWLEKQGEQKLNGTFVNVDDVREDFIDEVYRVLDADPTNDRANQIIDAFDNLPTITIKQDPCEHCKMTYSTCYSFPCDEKKAFEQGKSALEAINEEKVDNSNKVEPKFKVKYAGNEYNVLEVKDIAGVTYYGIEDEPNHIDYVQAENCERVDGYSIKESGSPFPTKPAKFSEQNSTWSEEDEGILDEIIDFLENGTVKLQHDLSLYASWLKSLKDRYAWRASWEQLDALEYHLKHTNENSRLYKETKELYDQLKKLK